jgi:hypothetical protein
MNALLAEFRRSLKRPECEEWADLYIYRPFGFLLVKTIYRTNITPNQLSLVSMVLGVLAGACLGWGGEHRLVAAAVLLFVSIVVDCSDGQLARLKHNGTPLGRLIDGLADYVVGLAVYLGLGFGFRAGTSHAFVWWALVAAAAASNGFHSIVFDYYRNRYLEAINGSTTSGSDEVNAFREELAALPKRTGTALRRLFLRTYIRYSLLQRRLTPSRARVLTAEAGRMAEYQKGSRRALRMWSFLGSSTQGTILIVSALAGRLDFYFWGMVVVRNALAATMFVVQRRLDRDLAVEPRPAH